MGRQDRADPLPRRVALLRVDGHTVDEIAERIGRSNKTVDRRLNLIRRLWRWAVREVGDGCG
jgi:DNA-directed RNA polymerase specialized sigma24 family protein